MSINSKSKICPAEASGKRADNTLGASAQAFGDLNDDGILDPNTEIQVRKDSFEDANDYYACICPSRPFWIENGRRKHPRSFARE